jgi:hypothetical protein
VCCWPAAAAPYAFEIETGNPDLSVRWDNTVRLNYGVRVENRDPRSATRRCPTKATTASTRARRSPSASTCCPSWTWSGSKRHGFRLSGAGWYDGAYGDTSKQQSQRAAERHPELREQPVQPNTTKRLYHGPSGEILDAFAFTGFDLGNVPVQAKAGRHTLYWGESLFLGGHMHSIAYAQNSLDLQKGFATPGTEAKELFRPLNQLSAQAQLTDELSVAGQYLLQWESARYPEGGTYLGPVDFVFNGPDRQFLSPALGFASRGPAAEPSQHGEFGLSARWSPKASTAPWASTTAASPTSCRRCCSPVPGPANTSQYNMVYADASTCTA